MARRKSKARQQEELIDALIKGTALIAFVATYYSTKSFIVSVILALIALAIVVVILAFLQMRRTERLKSSGIEEIDKMDGFQFERYLSHLFKSYGYQTKVTKSTGDFGADLIISKNGMKIAVQAKRYSKNVGIKAVQEAQSSIAHYGASEAWVVTNSDFTEAAYTLAESNKVRLINRKKLIDMILNKDSESSKASVLEFMNQSNDNTQGLNDDVQLKCAWCGSEMIKRKGARGEFYGCRAFPRCRYTMSS